jgi:hypothetical protein
MRLTAIIAVFGSFLSVAVLIVVQSNVRWRRPDQTQMRPYRPVASSGFRLNHAANALRPALDEVTVPTSLV